MPTRPLSSAAHPCPRTGTPTGAPARLRTRLVVGALLAPVLAALCAGCGPGGPKRDTGSAGDGGTSAPSAGITLVAGNPTISGSANGKGAAARFDTPRGIAIDSAGNLYVADQLNNAIRKIAPDGTVSTFAGLMGASGSANANGGKARFSQPTAIAIDAGGNLFVTDLYAIRKITPSADVSTVLTLASGNPFGSVNQTVPAGIAVDAAGNLYVTSGVDTRRITSSNRATTLETGTSVSYTPGTDALIPRGVAVDASGVAWVADLGNTISQVTASATNLTRFAGATGQTGSADGNASTVRFQQVVGLTVDQDNNLYAADAINNTVRKITPNALTTTVAGSAGSSVLATGKLPGRLAPLGGITNDGKGNLYAISGNAVVKITLP